MRALCVTSHSDRPETELFIGLQQSGVDLEVLCPPEAPHRQRLLDAGIAVTDLTLAGRFDREGARRIRERMVARSPDILHLFNNNAASNGLRASRGLPATVICYRGIEGNVSFFDPISWTTYLHPRVDRIICVAEAIRRHFLGLRLFGYRLPETKVLTIHKGHDLAWYDAPPLDLAEFGIPAGAFTIVCVASVRPRKGLPVLLAATHHLPADPRLHLLLVGNMESAPIRKLIAASPMRDRIHLAGYRRDAPAISGACQVAVLPSIKREGLPKTVIEAMVYGVPAVVTDSGGSPELILDGECGRIVPPGDAKALAGALAEMFRDPERTRQMGTAARERIRRDFPIARTVERTLDVYRELVTAQAW